MSWKWSKDDDRNSETHRENERNWKNNEFYFQISRHRTFLPYSRLDATVNDEGSLAESK